ncbi:sialidase family protein [Conexibacter sp. JD483]|uniref:sialidase family protein n=1 Tax=unclassified Conexibacter TaxID=2627773 RepID=UPI0027259EAA|nr:MULTISPECIES: sialidase family protein [unclassified Conexibacter]MDO8187103.1 sialidase family protein [Conexibacter sp. CPCC 205706]MDO8200961.1 sialidase family protein [Conexibacter sp. CPCC 205762]MDR9371886.1 sialidase family protein [Conexibacter sp. JD483]
MGIRRMLVAAVAATAASLIAATGAQATSALTETSYGWVNDGTRAAFATGATRAANGDLLVSWNNGADGGAGAQIFLARSTDDGRTWGAPLLFRSPSHWARGSMNAQDSLTTLSDGTILMPFTEGLLHTNFTDRESDTYVARSTDNGVTWSGLTTPIALPNARYFNASYGRVVELPDRTLLMPVWGTDRRPSTATGLEDPEPWEAGALRSFDGGRTWPDYRTIGLDAASGPPTTSVSNPDPFPSNVTETVVTRMRDGRLLAVLRADSEFAGNVQWWYESWSGDGGATWSEPVQSSLIGQGQDLISAPCTASLPGTAEKLLLGYRDRSTLRMTVRSSFDGGANWIDPVTLTDPPGPTSGYAMYAAMVPLPGNRVFVAYSRTFVGVQPRVAYSILQDATGTTCQNQLSDAQAAAAARPNVFVSRADAADWPWPYGRKQLSAAATATVGSLATAAVSPLTCSPGPVTLYKNGVALNPALTLAAAGVVNGDKLTAAGAPRGRALEVGFADLDTYPAHHHVRSWDTACATTLGFDYWKRSLAVHQPLAAGQQITSLSLRDSDASTRLTAADYQLWSSPDGDDWTAVGGWTLTATVSGGRLTHTFGGLAVSDPYVKVSQRYDDRAFTFVINSRNDVNVTVTP